MYLECQETDIRTQNWRQFWREVQRDLPRAELAKSKATPEAVRGGARPVTDGEEAGRTGQGCLKTHCRSDRSRPA